MLRVVLGVCVGEIVRVRLVVKVTLAVRVHDRVRVEVRVREEVGVLCAGVCVGVLLGISSGGVIVALSMSAAYAPGNPPLPRRIFKKSRVVASFGRMSGANGMSGRLSGRDGILTATGTSCSRRQLSFTGSTNVTAVVLTRLSARSCVVLQVGLVTIHPLFISMPIGSVVSPFQKTFPTICKFSSARLGAGMPLYMLGVTAGATAR